MRKLAVTIRSRLCIHPCPSSWRIPASTIGYPVRPAFHRLDGVRRLVVAHARELGPQVLPRAARGVPEHVGVELAPCQLVLVRRHALPALPGEVGEEGPRVQHPP